MKIREVETWSEQVDLKRPYAIAYAVTDAVQLFGVRLHTDGGLLGRGAASPVKVITGETAEACGAALQPAGLAWLEGRDPRQLHGLCRELRRRLPKTPAARAALDIALHDLFAQSIGIPLVEFLGRCHDALPTSITIGIKSVEESLAEAREYLDRGFDHLKVKLGRDAEQDRERLIRLRESCGPATRIRVDANQGYSVDETLALGELAARLGLELIEQPLPASEIHALRGLPAELRRMVAADESLHDEHDALALLQPEPACGIFNIKLMKCGGIRSALTIARFAEVAGVELMWGCMDESVVSISAALHAALASPATRYLDLDGSFDLARDLARGGFVLERGTLRTNDRPGLGLEAHA